MCVLGSGSKGNCIFVNVDGSQFLIDCGFTKKETAKRLDTIGRSVKDIEQVFITHDHGDHCAAWVKKEELVVNCHGLIIFNYWHGKYSIRAFPLSHDSGSGSVGYTIKDSSGNKVAVIMDTGCIPEEVIHHLFDCSAILIETSYDIDMLVAGKYPTELQERIASDTGHLRNECAAELVEAVSCEKLKHIVCLHLSESNNHPDLARFCMESVKTGAEVVVSDQKKPSKMIVIM